MLYQIVELECPGCGYKVTSATKQCPKCFGQIIFDSFNSVASMTQADIGKYREEYGKVLANYPKHPELNISMAFCFLKVKLYEKAQSYFEKAIESNAEESKAYFYAAVCMLRGKRPFLVQKAVIRKIEEYVAAAIELEPKGIYYYFIAYIKYDYYQKKYFRTSPTYKETMILARQAGLLESEITELNEILSTELPLCLK